MLVRQILKFHTEISVPFHASQSTKKNYNWSESSTESKNRSVGISAVQRRKVKTGSQDTGSAFNNHL